MINCNHFRISKYKNNIIWTLIWYGLSLLAFVSNDGIVLYAHCMQLFSKSNTISLQLFYKLAKSELGEWTCTIPSRKFVWTFKCGVDIKICRPIYLNHYSATKKHSTCNFLKPITVQCKLFNNLMQLHWKNLSSAL